MKKILLFIMCFFSSIAQSEIKWNVPFDDLSKYSRNVLVKDMLIGEESRISEYANLCINVKGNLSLDATTEAGDGKTRIKILPGKKIGITISDPDKFLGDLIRGKAYWDCFTSIKDEHLYEIDNINGIRDLRDLYIGN